MKKIILIITIILTVTTNAQQFTKINFGDSDRNLSVPFFKPQDYIDFNDLYYYKGKLIALNYHYIHTSENYGLTWQNNPTAPYSNRILLVDSYLFAISSNGTFRTNLDNIQWEEVFYDGKSIPNAVACQSEGLLYLMLESKTILKSTDYGKTFQENGKAPVTFSQMFKYGEYLFGEDYNSYYKGELFYSKDNSVIWKQIASFPASIKDLIVKDQNVVVVTIQYHGNVRGPIFTAPLSSFHNIEWETHYPYDYFDVEEYNEYLFAIKRYSGTIVISNDLFNTFNEVHIPTDNAFKILIAENYLYIVAHDYLYRTEINNNLVNSWIEKGTVVAPYYCFRLDQNYPNPFTTTTTISFVVPVDGFVSLKVYDIIGKEVAILHEGELKLGTYSIPWDASSYCSGVYFYRIIEKPNDGGHSFTEVKKMLLIK